MATAEIVAMRAQFVEATRHLLARASNLCAEAHSFEHNVMQTDIYCDAEHTTNESVFVERSSFMRCSALIQNKAQLVGVTISTSLLCPS